MKWKVFQQKKVLASLLALLLCAAAAGCTQNTASSSGTDTGASSTEENALTQAPDQQSKPDESDEAEIFVFAAASLTDCMDELTALYQKEHPQISFVKNYDSSGKLQAQIEEGAPCDLFISAAQKQMDALAEKDLIISDSRADLLVNKVVLITPKGNPDKVISFEDAADDRISAVAIGDPASVPAGEYAEKVFTSLGIWEKITAKATLGGNVREVLAWVETGEVSCGVVYATDAAIVDSVEVICEAPEGSCEKILYPAAVTANAAAPKESADFLTFLSSAEASAIFEKYGFGVV